MSTVFLWRMVALITAILSGYLTGHVIVLARYFDWLIANGHAAMLKTTYSVFRVEGDPVTPYLGSFMVQFAVAVLLLVVGFRQRAHFGNSRLAAAALAALCLPLSVLVFTLTGFHDIEHDVMSASDLSSATLETWLTLNVPLHVISAGIYIAAAMAMLLSDPPHHRRITAP
ncbi:hypothetical protein [Eilatimonas milleporae]|uniref:DUF1772 domain-containing protein n=1 Tax=Eilatimonas milleporae TaxID=911205 RepID=A0A3M0CHX7_9PROT|nr:hypothetical protein [Eilatimonas milleporae]RMB08435.1 hypothetical protein BXY39_1068 [Eilatimonas milleporae]